jgi:hypothetical protein
MKNLISEK